MSWSRAPEPASWLRRVWAHSLDMLMFWAPALLVLGGAAFWPSRTASSAVFAGLLLFALYAVFWFALLPRGATPGKACAGIRVVREDGRPAGFWLMLVREAMLKFLASALLSLVTAGIYWAADCLWPLWDQRRQSLHDKMAGTVVVTGTGAGSTEDLGERLARVFGEDPPGAGASGGLREEIARAFYEDRPGSGDSPPVAGASGDLREEIARAFGEGRPGPRP